MKLTKLWKSLNKEKINSKDMENITTLVIPAIVSTGILFI